MKAAVVGDSGLEIREIDTPEPVGVLDYATT